MTEWMKFLKWYKKRKKIKSKGLIRHVSDRLGRSSLRYYFGDKLVTFPKSYLRRYFGRKKIKSNHFKFRRVGNAYIISGRGNGHGIGMCQIGALYKAREGMNYQEILSFYYPKLKIIKAY